MCYSKQRLIALKKQNNQPLLLQTHARITQCGVSKTCTQTTKPKKKRKRGKRAGRRKQRKINVVWNHLNGKKSIGNVPNCANLDNLVKIKINRNKKMTEPLKLAFMNAQSICNDKTTLINDLITDSKIDFLLITESWLKPVGSERDIKALTPPGFKLISFPRPSRGGGVCLIYRGSMTFKCVPLLRFKSFEGYEFRIQLPSRSIVFVGIHRPPPSTKNKLTIPMFMEEFPDLLDLRFRETKSYLPW